MTRRWVPSPEPGSAPGRAISGFAPGFQDRAAVLVVVVAAVGRHRVRSVARPAALAAHRRHGLEERTSRVRSALGDRR
jgi:hypothetical protein